MELFVFFCVLFLRAFFACCGARSPVHRWRHHRRWHHQHGRLSRNTTGLLLDQLLLLLRHQVCHPLGVPVKALHAGVLAFGTGADPDGDLQRSGTTPIARDREEPVLRVVVASWGVDLALVDKGDELIVSEL